MYLGQVPSCFAGASPQINYALHKKYIFVCFNLKHHSNFSSCLLVLGLVMTLKELQPCVNLEFKA